MPFEILPRIEKYRMFYIYLYKASIMLIPKPLRGNPEKEIYRFISLMNIGLKFSK